MLTTSDSIFYFLKPHISKSKTCFEILVKKSFRWHLETWENQIGSIFKLNIKKLCQIPKKKFSQIHVHGILFFLQIHVPGYMIFCFFLKSMYPGTWNFPSISYYFQIPKIFLNFFPHTGKNRNRRKSNLLP